MSVLGFFVFLSIAIKIGSFTGFTKKLEPN